MEIKISPREVDMRLMPPLQIFTWSMMTMQDKVIGQADDLYGH